jgi:hypothetical protein
MKTIKKKSSLKIINIIMNTSSTEVLMQLLLQEKKELKMKIKILLEVTDAQIWNLMSLLEYLKI